MSVAERLTLWLAQLRAAGRTIVLSRLLIAIAGTVAIVLPGALPWDQLDLIPILAVPLLIATIAIPDSLTALLFVLTVLIGWLMRAPAELGWGVVVTGIALLLVHLATAFTAQLPSYVRVGRKALRRWLAPAVIAVLIGPVVAVAAALVRGADVPGSLLVTVGALVLATVTVWFAAGQRLGED
ncbi:hypothetical protein HPO96_31320 [Kribbella sandramycini]|uniref:Uncharacterized protein n=1 Tax=Kribbella sandramycini TaxID=60450 RepID=A0A7Y4P445_9ACTN|nr:hypothetical protein [Kribbella sandramycini]MBB6567029.1 hypothetical protein [Kribbella sandramycini]NOL44750.1 hypothetical protein [Kribbella sandramycini]